MEQARKIEKVYGYPSLLADKKTHFCPGCSHGILSKVISEVIAEMGLRESAIGVYGVGCAVLMYDYLKMRGAAAFPGGAAGVASGLKQGFQDKLIFTYQGEGDIIYDVSALLGAAMRGEKITVICENNFNMGISGGALSPTTPVGISTTSAPSGREVMKHGFPIRIAELLAGMKGVSYLARGSTHSPGAVKKVKSMIRKAFTMQMYGTGMGFIEIIGMCPTNMHLPPIEAAQRVREILEELPTGELK